MNMQEWTTEVNDLGAYGLASMAECLSPDGHESEGALMLLSIRDDVVRHVVDGQIDLDRGCGGASDCIHEMADDAPDIYTYTRWQQFIDLGAWQEAEDASGLASSDDMTAMAGACLYLIAERLCVALLDMYEPTESGDDDE